MRIFRRTGSGFQPIEQLIVDPAKSAVGHDRNHIALAEFRRKMFDDDIRIGEAQYGLALHCDIIDELVHIKDLA